MAGTRKLICILVKCYCKKSKMQTLYFHEDKKDLSNLVLYIVFYIYCESVLASCNVEFSY